MYTISLFRFFTLLATGTSLLLSFCGYPQGHFVTQTPPNIFQATLGERGSATPEISTEELQALLASLNAVLIDTRPHFEGSISHIPGALNVAPKPGMTMSQYTSDIAEIGRLVSMDKSRLLVLYCNGPFCEKSKRVAEDLVANGYTNVRRYQLGAPVWRALSGHMIMFSEKVCRPQADLKDIIMKV